MKGFKGGKGVKGKSSLGNRMQESSSSSSAGTTNISENYTPVVCDFCHKPNHIRQNCRKLQALNNSKTYRQARGRHDNRRQFIFNMLENSVFSPHTCSWCLSTSCDGIQCYPAFELNLPSFIGNRWQDSWPSRSIGTSSKPTSLPGLFCTRITNLGCMRTVSAIKDS